MENKPSQHVLSLLESSDWPEAASAIAICQTETDFHDRANIVLDFTVNQSVTNRKFLDFGCGDGHIVQAASRRKPTTSIGYDPFAADTEAWRDGHCTTDLEHVRSLGPFDLILMFDVLDHVSDPVEVLKTARSLLARDGTLYARCHPWCGRHGGHMYRTHNKAFSHLVLNDAEWEALGLVKPPIQPVLFPLATYRKYFDGLFHITEETPMFTPVEPWFRQTAEIRDRIRRHWADSGNAKAAEWPEFQMSQSFVNYVLQ